ncbi:hypothetical protein [Persephonella sp. IF05-L8]|uniref:hypothetical protein n=1 Tax=Persephonella sp. IF05-L8 TaxID=1158338 RepID=UPI00049583FA
MRNIQRLRELLEKLENLNDRENENYYKKLKETLEIILEEEDREIKIFLNPYVVGGLKVDLAILENEKIIALIEYKRGDINSSESNFFEGKLPNLEVNHNIISIKKSGDSYYPNRENDFFGQLRGYIGLAVKYNICWINKNAEKILYPVDKEKIFGILTNGKDWYLFHYYLLTNKRQNIENILYKTNIEIINDDYVSISLDKKSESFEQNLQNLKDYLDKFLRGDF